MGFAGAIVNVRGVVQGVGFRWWCVKRAKDLSLSGYAANLYDGSVEVAIEGERGLVEEFIKILKVGPTYAKVSDTRIQWYEKPKGYEDFTIEVKG